MSKFLCELGFHRFEWKRGVYRCLVCKYSQRGPRKDDPFVLNEETTDSA